jgi:nicotinamidase-related amidase
MTDTNSENPMVAAMREALKPYQVFPKNRTALVLINCQKGFLDEQPELQAKLDNLTRFARQNNWKIIHAPFGYKERKFPAPAHLFMDEKLKISSTSEDLLYVEQGDITLSSRTTLSAFSETDLENILQKNSLEHLVLAGPVADLTLDSTMRDGIQNDFHIAIVTDALALTNPSQSLQDYIVTLGRYAQTITNLAGLKKLAAES